MTDDTMVAVATPHGRGGIGVVRISGAGALEIASKLIRLPNWPPQIQHATLGDFIDSSSGAVLDQVVVTYFQQPRSYTGEDVVEVSCHGAPVILRHLLECSTASGARLAEPGEFTMRAFLNGRIDLSQAEAVRDLIESRTLYQARVAAQQIGGAVSARLSHPKKALVELIARLEAGIDFAEDDVPVSEWDEIASRIDAIRADLDRLRKSYEFGRIVRDGLTLAILGRPNVGKSSLFNRLLNEDRAIVTATPGTTRDLVSETASIGGIPVRLVDTAGIRATGDQVERIGVEKSLQALAESDLRLLVVDASEGWTAEDELLFERVRAIGRVLVAVNKCDLVASEKLGLSGESGSKAEVDVVWTSALTGEGVSRLQELILALVAPQRDLEPEGEVVTNLRHRDCIQEALRSLSKARESAGRDIPHEMLLLDLYDALHALDAVTGATTTDDLLGVIFSSFCVGK
ncbi:MAG TPA: tRNA uridine-5-carboxymethylaminomethyl(34) synthesis GTPase MnmE [Terriglobia bacterium]|nr:tRNA uridine-5-carboxymethylaminomethyl(34) synthesis GTPase MnmE [Terriglobia bacterium]